MKCTIPEISWHNRDPVLSVDIQPVCKSEKFERLATGGTDSHVVIWHLEIQNTGTVTVEFAADLQRHQKAVNVVRFSPSGEFLASGDDESVIIVWKQKTDQDAPELPLGDNENTMKEQWLGVRVLRGHMEDVYDLSWSPDSSNLVSGSVDNSAILWDVLKGRNLGILKEHKGFVQGVTWDPNNQYVATLSSDRMCRVYNVNSKKLVSRVNKAQLPVAESSELHGKVVRLFHDDTLKSFFRRLCFSPDGQLLIVPSGIIENPNSDKKSNATFIFTRRMLNRPSVFLPSNNQYTVAVKCCPLLFELRDRESMFALPYRMILAVATQNSVLLYDTQQPEPFGIISNIHYTRLTDLTWSSNGRVLVVSSTDGYCSIVTFALGELGVVYEPKKDTLNETVSKETTKVVAGDGGGKKKADCEITTTEKVPATTEEQGQGAAKPECTEAASRTLDGLVEANRLDKITDSSSGIEKSKQSEENIKISVSQETVGSFKLFGKTEVKNIPKPEKTPRRIKPILISSPRKVKPSHSNISNTESELSFEAPRRIQSTPLVKVSKTPDDTNTTKRIHSPLSPGAETSSKHSEETLATDEKHSVSSKDNNIGSSNKKTELLSSQESMQLEITASEDMGGAGKLERLAKSKDSDATGELQSTEMDTDSTATKLDFLETNTSAISPLPTSCMPGQDKRTPRRVQLITLSSPKSKKKLL